jgi:hypothetical protein
LQRPQQLRSDRKTFVLSNQHAPTPC